MFLAQLLQHAFENLLNTSTHSTPLLTVLPWLLSADWISIPALRDLLALAYLSSFLSAPFRLPFLYLEHTKALVTFGCAAPAKPFLLFLCTDHPALSGMAQGRPSMFEHCLIMFSL